jgi:hypothetical protein
VIIAAVAPPPPATTIIAMVVIVITIAIVVMMTTTTTTMIMMILLINNSSNSDFDPHSLNFHFLKFFCMIVFFFQFHPLIFNLLGIRFHDFSRLSVSGLMIRVMDLKS